MTIRDILEWFVATADRFTDWVAVNLSHLANGQWLDVDLGFPAMLVMVPFLLAWIIHDIKFNRAAAARQREVEQREIEAEERERARWAAEWARD